MFQGLPILVEHLVWASVVELMSIHQVNFENMGFYSMNSACHKDLSVSGTSWQVIFFPLSL